MKVAVVGDEAVAEIVGEAGATLTSSDSANLVVTVGERRFAETAHEVPDAPLLPVDAEFGTFSLSRDRLADAVGRLVDGAGTAVGHPVCSAFVGGEEVTRGVLDAMLVTSEPARISEYEVAFDEVRIAEFRADGVVVATPLGTRGYARAAGGPLLEPGTGLSVVPVSPFATQSDVRVTVDDVTLTVARDEGPVSLVVDGESVQSVAPHQPVRLSVVDSVDLWHLPSMR